MQRYIITLALTTLLLAMSSAVLFADAATVTLKNRCPHDISVYDEFNRLVCKIGAGSMHSPTTGCSRNITKNGGAEFYLSKNGSLVYYDLSIVPPIAFDCHSYEACKEKTGSSGFNIGMQVRPDSSQTRVGLRRIKNCRAEICEHDGCAGAYHFPTDHKKLHYCPSETDFKLYFCT